ncbi:hypothetical protein D3C75_809670 [compost metagenome]
MDQREMAAAAQPAAAAVIRRLDEGRIRSAGGYLRYLLAGQEVDAADVADRAALRPHDDGMSLGAFLADEADSV